MNSLKILIVFLIIEIQFVTAAPKKDKNQIDGKKEDKVEQLTGETSGTNNGDPQETHPEDGSTRNLNDAELNLLMMILALNNGNQTEEPPRLQDQTQSPRGQTRTVRDRQSQHQNRTGRGHKQSKDHRKGPR
ncbi:hypothetical protein ACQ4LE_002816 [Meloidogyne hapla]